MPVTTASSYNWKLFYLGLPLLPFVIGGALKFLVIISSCNDQIIGLLDTLILVLTSFDVLKFAFATSLMAFIVKRSLTEHPILLNNSDKSDEIASASSLFGILGILGLVCFGVIILIELLYERCSLTQIESLYISMVFMTYILGLSIIRKGLKVQKQFKLSSKPIF